MLTGQRHTRAMTPRSSDPELVFAVYGADGRVVPCGDWRQARDVVRAAGGFVWVGLRSPQAHEFDEVAEHFDLPPLAAEDAVRAHQRPKLEQHRDMLFVVVKPAVYIDSDEVIDVSELAVFLGQDFVVGVRHGSTEVPRRVRTEFAEQPRWPAHGPSAVLYRLLDEVVDGYEHALVDIQVDLDDIESRVFRERGQDHAERIYLLKSEVLDLQRAVAPLTMVTHDLAERDVLQVNPDLLPFFRDVHDHVLRAAETVSRYDALLSDVLQAHLAQVGVAQNQVAMRQNEDMRKISAWAAIALLPTAIAGIYGMNFDNMPELRTRYGYYVVLAAITLTCGLLYLNFRRRRWL